MQQVRGSHHLVIVEIPFRSTMVPDRTLRESVWDSESLWLVPGGRVSDTHNIEAGPELDKLVAEFVMGGAEQCRFRCPDCNGTHFGTSGDTRNCHSGGGYHCGWHGKAESALPRFSVDINSAWEALIMTKEEENVASVHVYSERGEWYCEIERIYVDDEEALVMESGETAALAICRAVVEEARL